MFSSSVNSNFPRRRNPEVRHGSASGRKNIASVVLSTTTPPPPASFVARYSSSSGVGFTRLVLRRTPPPPALVSRVLCCDVPLSSCHETSRRFLRYGNFFPSTFPEVLLAHASQMTGQLSQSMQIRRARDSINAMLATIISESFTSP